MKNNNQQTSVSKYDKDLKELDLLKDRAKRSKPKKRMSPGNFFRILLTLTLLITLFAIAFSLAYQKSIRDSQAENINFIPEAKIILPTETP